MNSFFKASKATTNKPQRKNEVATATKATQRIKKHTITSTKKRNEHRTLLKIKTSVRIVKICCSTGELYIRWQSTVTMNHIQWLLS